MASKSWIIVAFAAIFGLTAGQGEDFELQILPEGSEQTKATGESLLLTCTATGVEPTVQPNLKWFDKEDREITQTSGRVYIERDGNLNLKLYITNIDNEDAGTYTCRGDVNGITDELIVSLNIFKDITFDHAPSPQYKAIHTDALIECQVSGQPPPTVSWRYNGQTISTGPRYTFDQKGLIIKNITQSDDDYVYLCRAEVLSAGRYDQREISVEVHIPPTISQPMGTMQGVAGQEVSLSCFAEGDPPPKYEFYRGDNTSPIQGSERVIVDTDAGHVHFKPLLEEDKGDYRCKAINDVGDAEDRGQMVVLVPPKIETLVNQTGQEGQAQSLVCEVVGDPYPNITFKKDGMSEPYKIGENLDGKIVVTYTTNNNPDNKKATLEMEIKNLSPEDTANYTCDARNDAGQTDKKGTIIVKYSPRFKEGEETVFYLWAGKTRNVTCRTEAEPVPAIKWMKAGVQLINNETYKIYNMGKDSNLQITCNEQDQGWIYDEYTCHADNDINPPGELPIQVERASLPGPPQSASVRESSPTMVHLDVVPPLDNGGIPIVGYRIQYNSDGGGTRDVALDALGNGSEPIRIENLNPNTMYVFQIRAKNEVGAGSPLDFEHQTENIRKPSPLDLEPAPDPPIYSFEYELKWGTPETGGLDINQYEFLIRQVQVKDDGTFDKPLDDFLRLLRDDNPDRPMQSFMFTNLNAASHYEVKARARNDIGWSDEHPQFLFATLEDPTPVKKGDDGTPAAVGAGLGTGSVIGIIIVAFLILLIIVDVSCYFMNGCGILMCICVNLCGKPPVVSKEKSMEEGESKEVLKCPAEEAAIVQEQEVVTEATPEKEALPADEEEKPESPKPDEKKADDDGEEPMEELEPEDKEEKTDDVITDRNSAVIDQEEPEVELEPDEKTPLNEGDGAKDVSESEDKVASNDDDGDKSESNQTAEAT